MRKLLDPLLVLISSLLLIFSFPKTDLWMLAWIAFIPLFFILQGKNKGISFLIGYILGMLFFTGTLYWFIYVTTLGTFTLISYLSLYFGFFALFYSVFSKRKIASRLVLIPSAWVGLEFIRAHMLTGFSWVSLAHSQYKNLALIQIADITGMLGVSFVVMMANVLLYDIIRTWFTDKNMLLRKKMLLPAGVVLCVLIACYGYGSLRISENKNRNKPSAKIAIVQASIPQEIKWLESARPYIVAKYKVLTRHVLKDKPDLIVWPETAFPSYVWEVPEMFEELKSFVDEIDIPLLLGLVTKIGEDYYNSAMLIDKNGQVAKKHDKLHLVLFGEYIPLRDVFPFLSGIVPIGDFTAGEKYTTFPMISEGRKIGDFSVLICFEDTVSYLSRNFTKAGAGLLINMTNDAWFQDTKAPFIHLSASVFRTIENRRVLVRSTNTGVSCFIDTTGKIISFVENEDNKKTYVSGHRIETIALNDKNTLYTKYGDIFTYLCFGSILLGVVARKYRFT